MSPKQISASYTSFDEMSEKTGFKLDFCQLERGKLLLKTKTTVLPEVITSEFYYSRAIHQRGIAPGGYASFGIRLGNSQSRHGGKSYGSDSLTDFNARNGYESISSGPFSAKTIQVKVDRLLDTAELHGIDLSSLYDKDYAVTCRVDSTRLQPLKDALVNMEMLGSSLGSQPHGKTGINVAEDTVYRNLAICLDCSQRDHSVSGPNRVAIMKRSIDFIRSHQSDAITVTDICRACATTSRTLERVFREELGVTPKQYLTMARLSGVREELCRKHQEKSIGEIAASRGFWHMSQFAQDYKNLFGELPSQTKS